MANLSKYQHSLETCKTNWLLPTSAFRSFDYTRALTFFKSFLIPLSEPLLSLRHLLHQALRQWISPSNNHIMTLFANDYGNYLDAAIQALEKQDADPGQRFLQPDFPFLTPPFGRLTSSKLFQMVSQHLDAADRAIGQEKVLKSSGKNVFSFEPTALENKAIHFREQGLKFYSLIRTTIRNLMQKFRNHDWTDNPPVVFPVNRDYITNLPDPSEASGDKKKELAYIRMYIALEVLVGLLIRPFLLNRMVVCQCIRGSRFALKVNHSLSTDFENKFRLYSIYWTTSYNQISFYFNGLGDPFDTSDTIDTLDKLCDAASLSCLCTLSDEDSRSEDIITEPGSPKLPPTPPKTPPPADSSEISSPSKGCDEVD